MTIDEGISKGHIKLWSLSKSKTSKPVPKKLGTTQKKQPAKIKKQKSFKPTKTTKPTKKQKLAILSTLSRSTKTPTIKPACEKYSPAVDKPPKTTKTCEKKESAKTSLSRSNKTSTIKQLPSCEQDSPTADEPSKPTRTLKKKESTKKSILSRSNKAPAIKQLPSYNDDLPAINDDVPPIDESPNINKTCEWYYEAQGCLHVTNRSYCLIVVYTNMDFRIQRIDKDDNFWKTFIQPRLVTFFNNELLPMIINKSRA